MKKKAHLTKIFLTLPFAFVKSFRARCHKRKQVPFCKIVRSDRSLQITQVTKLGTVDISNECMKNPIQYKHYLQLQGDIQRRDEKLRHVRSDISSERVSDEWNEAADSAQRPVEPREAHST